MLSRISSQNNISLTNFQISTNYEMVLYKVHWIIMFNTFKLICILTQWRHNVGGWRVGLDLLEPEVLWVCGEVGGRPHVRAEAALQLHSPTRRVILPHRTAGGSNRPGQGAGSGFYRNIYHIVSILPIHILIGKFDKLLIFPPLKTDSISL